MAVEQLKAWQYDIEERAVYGAERIMDDYMSEIYDVPDEIVDMRNGFYKLRALVQYSMADNNRAQVLLQALESNENYLHRDLCTRGPQGKTKRELPVFKLSSKAREALGPNLEEFKNAVRDRSILHHITDVNGPLDFIQSEGLLLPEEYYNVYNMQKDERGRFSEIKQLLRSSVLPKVAKDSILLILAAFNMHSFGVLTRDPERFLEKA
ncbi:unnamed protein product [Oreochromis niloticus]|nr:unnamed protein product [Mustela putorius furo]